MAPVGALERPFSTMAERLRCSANGPWQRPCLPQVSHQSTVSCRRRSSSSGPGISTSLSSRISGGRCMMERRRRSPARTVKVAVRSWRWTISSGISPETNSPWQPPRAMWAFCRYLRSHGLTAPMSKRAAIVTVSSIEPESPSTTRNSWWCGLWAPPARMVKQSVRRTRPEPVSKTVSRTRAFWRYSRRTSCRADGAIRQYPARSQSRIRPKQLFESRRGIQHQSMEPDLPTSAAEWQSAMKP